MEEPNPETDESVRRADRSLTIVAIGASAGGLEPLKEFFRAMPANPELAFVVVTHLPADHVSHLAELLDRSGVLRASQARDGEPVAGGRVYVIPPGTLIGIRNGKIRLEPRPDRPLRRSRSITSWRPWQTTSVTVAWASC
ncbi:MAG: hypothetical protein MZW92_75255 [Comamonadaceae bacterium]|nr:hypothetical protein [Comamonadaceae bacterium]